MARLWVLSDLHVDANVERWTAPAGVQADVIVVAGDYRNGGLRKSLRECARDFAGYLDAGVPLVYTPGNHDFYGAGLWHELETAYEVAREFGITLLAAGETATLAGLRFVGATLWTDFEIAGGGIADQVVARNGMNDFRRIRDRDWRRIYPPQLIQQHRAHRAALENVLQTPFAGRTVVVTHHAPSPLGLRHGRVTEPLDCAYASDMTEFIERLRPDVWIHGHTHVSRTYQVGETHVVVNPRGYSDWFGFSRQRVIERENPAFDPTLIVEV